MVTFFLFKLFLKVAKTKKKMDLLEELKNTGYAPFDDLFVFDVHKMVEPIVFVKDSSKTVAAFLNGVEKGLTVTAFKRVALGA